VANGEGGAGPGPTIWPIGFAVGIVCILAGLIVSNLAVAAGVIIAAVFGFLWAREATREYRGTAEHAAAEPAAVPESAAAREPAAAPEPDMFDEGLDTGYPRSVFLEASTLGIAALIGALVTLPVLGFVVLPSFENQEYDDVNLGPLDNFPEGKWVITTFFRDPTAGEVSHRVAYIRNNGNLSFTIISNRCAHLGCPVQPNGLVADNQRKTISVLQNKKRSAVTLTPASPSGFGCPCHGGQYDTEGNRTAGPPVRALDRYEYSIVSRNLVLNKPYSVAHVYGTGADAKIKAYPLTGPGQHVDGAESWLYPIQPPGR
jgi:quinol---cytochrome c reductase iron-sulfur subunit, bacillus type